MILIDDEEVKDQEDELFGYDRDKMLASVMDDLDGTDELFETILTEGELI